MPVSLEQLQSIQVGDAVYLTSHPLTVTKVVNPNPVEGFMPYFVAGFRSFVISEYGTHKFTRIVPASKRRKSHKRKQYAFSRTDGGRTAFGFGHETNDCTVRALALATGVSYADAHAHMKAHGRKDRTGAHVHKAYPASTLGGLVCKRLNDWDTYNSDRAHSTGTTVGQWLESGSLPSRCILSLSRHVIAVVDGKVCDSFQVGSRCKVNAVYGFYAPDMANVPPSTNVAEAYQMLQA